MTKSQKYLIKRTLPAIKKDGSRGYDVYFYGKGLTLREDSPRDGIIDSAMTESTALKKLKRFDDLGLDGIFEMVTVEEVIC